MAELFGKFAKALAMRPLRCRNRHHLRAVQGIGFGQSCRGYFLLQALGYKKAKVLHGGLAAWTASGKPTTTVPSDAHTEDVPHRQVGRLLVVADKDAMKAAIATPPPSQSLTCVTSTSGSVRAFAPYGKDFCPRKGRLPNAVWIEWYRMMKPTAAGQMFKSRAEILAECATVGITPDTHRDALLLSRAHGPPTRSWR